MYWPFERPLTSQNAARIQQEFSGWRCETRSRVMEQPEEADLSGLEIRNRVGRADMTSLRRQLSFCSAVGPEQNLLGLRRLVPLERSGRSAPTQQSQQVRKLPMYRHRRAGFLCSKRLPRGLSAAHLQGSIPEDHSRF